MISLSAFDPWMYPDKNNLGSLEGGELDTTYPDQINNWDVNIRKNPSTDLSDTNETLISVQQKL